MKCEDVDTHTLNMSLTNTKSRERTKRPVEKYLHKRKAGQEKRKKLCDERGDERIRLEAELREEPQVLARAVAVLKDLTEVLLDLAAKTLTRIVSALAHDAAHVLGVEGVAVYKTKNTQR